MKFSKDFLPIRYPRTIQPESFSLSEKINPGAVLGFILAVNASHIPCASLSASHHDTFARITTEQARLIPCSRHVRDKILYILWLGKITFRLISPMHQSRLKQDWQCQFMSMGSELLFVAAKVSKKAGFYFFTCFK